MPRISEVNGIVVAMYFADHWPPHFHVFYAGEEASLRIDTLDLLEGAVQNRALRLVRDWGEQHRAELQRNWEKARQGLPLDKIAPLE